MCEFDILFGSICIFSVMDLLYTCYRSQGRSSQAEEGPSLCAVSPRNILLFTTTSLAPGHDPPGTQVYCTDLNTPWAVAPVCGLEGEATCLAWDGGGDRFVVGDSGGGVQVWERREDGGVEWKCTATASFPLETFVACGFFLTSRPVCVSDERRESLFYTEKFAASSPWHRSSVPGCVLVSSSGILVCIAFPAELDFMVSSKSLGLGRRRVEHADVATTRDGRLVVAASGALGPVVVHTVQAGLGGQEAGLQLRVTTHSSFSVSGGEEELRVSCLRFLLSDCTSALVVGVTGQEGGRVQMWQLEQRQRQVHKLFGVGDRGSSRAAPEWRYTDEFQGVGGAAVVGLATPRSSVMGGGRAACYIAVAFGDGSVQCLLREGLQQIESVELPRGGNLGWGGKTPGQGRVGVSIQGLAFTATGNCLVAVDSLGQLYLYSMSPISDPGGPSSAPFTVQALEYCLVSGKDWWDLAIAFRPAAKLETICDRFAESYARQPSGVQRYYHSRFMSMKASLYRLAGNAQHRAADTTALFVLQAVNGAFKTLLRPADGNYSDSDPTSKLEMVLTGPEETQTDLDTVVAALAQSGLARDLAALEPGTLATLQHLATWATTLALHLLAAVPEYKQQRRGPGMALVGSTETMGLLRELLAMVRLWNMPKVSVITMEKDFDLTARLFHIVTRLMKKHDDEQLVDECLMLPHKVMIPALDTVQSPRGVAAALPTSAPLTFTLGQDPDMPPLPQPPFMEGLTYTEDPNSNFFYDCVQKMYLGESSASDEMMRGSSRC